MNRSTKIALFGTAAASIAALLLTSSCSSQRLDLVGDGKAALDRTEEDGRDAMAHSDKVDEGLERFQQLFDDYRPEAVAEAARAIYASDVYFNDGFTELYDSEELAEYFKRSAGHTAEIDVEIEELTKLESGVYLRWIMTFRTNGDLTIVAPGISHLRFDAEGRITYHRDYWDAGSALAELVPFTGSILRAVKSRL